MKKFASAERQGRRTEERHFAAAQRRFCGNCFFLAASFWPFAGERRPAREDVSTDPSPLLGRCIKQQKCFTHFFGTLCSSAMRRRLWPVAGGRRRFETGDGPSPLPASWPSCQLRRAEEAHRRGRTSLFRAVCTGVTQSGFLCTRAIEQWQSGGYLGTAPTAELIVTRCAYRRASQLQRRSATARRPADGLVDCQRQNYSELQLNSASRRSPRGSQAAAIYTMGHTAEGPDSNGKTPATAGRREENDARGRASGAAPAGEGRAAVVRHRGKKRTMDTGRRPSARTAGGQAMSKRERRRHGAERSATLATAADATLRV